MLTTPTDPRNASEIVFRENGVVVGQERRALPLSQRAGKKGLRGVAPAVEAETHGGGTGVVGVLYELLQYGRPLGIVQQHLSDTPRQVNLLAEVF